MQNTVGKHCCQETHKKLEDREILPANQGSSDQENAATSTYDVLYEDSKRRNSDCSNKSRVQFKLLMDLLMQYRVGLTLTWWVAGALLERTVVMQLGNCNSQWANHKDHRFCWSSTMHTPRAWQILTKMGTLSPAPKPSQAKCSSCLSQDTSVKAMSCTQPKLCTDIFASMHGSDLSLLGLGREQTGRKWTHPSEGLQGAEGREQRGRKWTHPSRGLPRGWRQSWRKRASVEDEAAPFQALAPASTGRPADQGIVLTVPASEHHTLRC